MGKPAARLTDMHVCPMVTPGLPPIPHVGGPITGPGCPTVLIGGIPAAVMGDMCVCVGPPDTIILGSTGVMIGGKPAARMGDQCAHGGTIAVGCPTVLIGETSSAGAGGSASGEAAVAAKTTNANAVAKRQTAITKRQTAIKSMGPAASVLAAQIAMMSQAAEDGIPLVHSPQTCTKCAKKLKQS